ncbi:MAG: tRNA (adenosine(37)-N6)-threonylcarbamoyltransferase complex dimerization subunit type 1 TsaB [Elusimicrobia bacterium]|nr:tRNA (adenosine(37)-N6)-threonylcarbamoyltransferase complex dimerization subunit type 1 TsaB [Elusimicrobiota bacterium]
MKLVAFETSTPCLGIALWADYQGGTEETIVADLTINHGLRHAETLLPNLRWLLQQVGWSLKDIQGVAASVGPGSFTGIRLGVAAARALGQGLGCPLVGVSTLEALATEAVELCEDCRFSAPLVVPLIPTLRDQVFTAVYTPLTYPPVKRLTPLQAMNVSRWLDQLTHLRLRHPHAASRDRRWIFVGAGAALHRATIQQWKAKEKSRSQVTILSETARGPRVATVARLGAKALASGKGQRFDQLLPVYLRPSLAEERMKESAQKR